MTDEVDRVREVYDRYARDPAVLRRWDPRRPGNRAMLEERESLAQRMLLRYGGIPDRGRVLDVGCGTGAVLARLKEQWPGVRPIGVDLMWDRVRTAATIAPSVSAAVGDGRDLPFPDGIFDLALAYTVFSSILDDDIARIVAAQMTRVTKPGGLLLLYDVRRGNSRNANTRPVGIDDVRAWFSGEIVDIQRLTLLPPLARVIGSSARWAYRPLAAFPPLRTHQLVLIRTS